MIAESLGFSNALWKP